jgi:hypothetical protein
VSEKGIRRIVPARAINAGLLAIVLLAAVAAAASAQGIDPGAGADGSDEIARIIGDIGVAVVRLLIGAGAAVFVIGVARGAFDGVLGSVLGAPGVASVGLTRGAGIAGAFVLMLVSLGLSRALVDLLVRQFVERGALTPPIPGQVHIYPPGGDSGLRALAGVIGEVLRIVLFLIGGWFLVGMLVALINGEIQLATGSPGALARLVERLVTSLVVLVIGASTPSLTAELARAIEGVGSIASEGGVIQLYGVVFAIVIDILLAVFVALLIVAAVGSGFMVQAGMALGLPEGLGAGVARVATAFALAVVGFGVIGLANRLLLFLLG